MCKENHPLNTVGFFLFNVYLPVFRVERPEDDSEFQDFRHQNYSKIAIKCAKKNRIFQLRTAVGLS